jgi:hypothetical protein
MSYPARRLDTSICFSSQVCVLGSNTRRVSVRVPLDKIDAKERGEIDEVMRDAIATLKWERAIS